MKLALFDLDNTLLSGDSDYAWGQFLIERGVLGRAQYEAQNDAFFEQYKAGTLDIHEYLGFALGPLAAHKMHELEHWREDFMASCIQPMINKAARELVERHGVAGDLCAIVTATNSFVTAPIARDLGVLHLIATEPEIANGRYTGRVAGTPCFREGKIECVERWLARLGHSLHAFSDSAFYSDSINDLPLLETVTHPVAVDPDERLAAEAARRGWPIITLR